MSPSQCNGRAAGCLLDSPENPKQEEGGCDEEGELVIEPEWRVQCHQSADRECARWDTSIVSGRENSIGCGGEPDMSWLSTKQCTEGLPSDQPCGLCRDVQGVPLQGALALKTGHPDLSNVWLLASGQPSQEGRGEVEQREGKSLLLQKRVGLSLGRMPSSLSSVDWVSWTWHRRWCAWLWQRGPGVTGERWGDP